MSDLHLGARGRQDVLRRERERAALVAGLRDCERLILLGDVLELRHGPLRAAVAQAEPVLRALGSAVDDVVVVAGNHDQIGRAHV